MDLGNEASRRHRSDGQLSNSTGNGYRLQELVRQFVAHINTPAPQALQELLDIPRVIDTVRTTRANDHMCAALKRQVDDATSKNDTDALWATWALVTPLLKAFPQEQRLKFSAERLVVAMQHLDPVGAAAMSLAGFDCGWALRSGTNVFTWARAQRAVRSYEDLKLVTDFSVRALSGDALDPSDPSVAERANVFLACTTDPKPAHRRIAPQYPAERTISDVAWRTVLGASAVDAVVRAGVAFLSETTIGRVDCSLRGIVSVGAALGLECARAEGRVDDGKFASVRQELALGFDWVAPDFGTHDVLACRGLAEWLLMESVQVACLCFTERPGNGQGSELALRYKIEGKTVANILLALERNKVSSDEAGCTAVATLLVWSLQTPEISPAVSGRAVHAALEWINRQDIDRATQVDAVMAVLPQALPKITDVGFLGRLSDRLLQYSKADPSIEETVLSCLELMGARVDELGADAERRARATAAKNETRVNSPAARGKDNSTWFSDLVDDALKRQGKI